MHTITCSFQAEKLKKRHFIINLLFSTVLREGREGTGFELGAGKF